MDHPSGQYKHLRWGPWSALIGSVVIFFMAQLVSVFGIYSFLMLRGWDMDRIDAWVAGGPQSQFIFSIVVAGMTLGILFAFLQLRRAHPRDLGLVAPRLRDVGYTALGFLAYVAMYISLVSVLTQLFPGLNTSQTQELGFSRDTAGDALLLVFISLVVLPPIVEEIVVRGFLFSGLRKKFSFLPAALLASALFGLAHLGGGEGGSTIWIAAIDTFILGLVLAYLRERTGSLWSAIGVHGIKNFIAFYYLFIYRDVL